MVGDDDGGGDYDIYAQKWFEPWPVVSQWFEHQSMHQEVVGLNPSQEHASLLQAGSWPDRGTCERQSMDVSLFPLL